MIQDDHPPSQQEELGDVTEAAKERPTPKTPKKITEPEVDKDAIILEQVLKAASAANLGKQTVQVATPVTVGMADALLGEAGKDVVSIEVVNRTDPRHQQLCHLPARTMITTEAARVAEAAWKTTTLVSQTASTRPMSPGLSQLTEKLAAPGSTSSQQAAVEQLQLEKKRLEAEKEVQESGSGYRSPPSRPLSPPTTKITRAATPYNITPATKSQLRALATSTPEVTSCSLTLDQEEGQNAAQVTAGASSELGTVQAGTVTTHDDSLARSMESPAASSIGRMMQRVASSQSTTGQLVPSPIPSSLNLSFSPDTRRELGAAFSQLKEAVRKDSTMTTASGDSTQTLDPPVHVSG